MYRGDAVMQVVTTHLVTRYLSPHSHPGIQISVATNILITTPGRHPRTGFTIQGKRRGGEEEGGWGGGVFTQKHCPSHIVWILLDYPQSFHF